MTDTNDTAADTERGYVQKLARILLLAGAVILLAGALGYLAGVTTAILEHGSLSFKDVGLLAAGLLVIAGCGFVLWKFRPGLLSPDPVSPKTRRAQWALVLSGALGGFIGLTLAVTEIQTGQSGVFSNGALPVTPAILVVAAYVLCLPLATLYWHRNADEFEKDASGQGALLGMYVYSLVAPSWWILERADLAPEQDPMLVFLLVVAIWGVVWQIRKAD